MHLDSSVVASKAFPGLATLGPFWKVSSQPPWTSCKCGSGVAMSLASPTLSPLSSSSSSSSTFYPSLKPRDSSGPAVLEPLQYTSAASSWMAVTVASDFTRCCDWRRQSSNLSPDQWPWSWSGSSLLLAAERAGLTSLQREKCNAKVKFSLMDWTGVVNVVSLLQDRSIRSVWLFDDGATERPA